MSKETHIFDRQPLVLVTDKRAVIHGKTYSMANITSVSQHMKPAQRGCAMLLMLFGALGGAIPVLGLASDGEIQAAAVFALMAAIPFLLGLVMFRAAKPTYTVVLGSASGEAHALSSPDGDLVHDIVAAINQALIERA